MSKGGPFGTFLWPLPSNRVRRATGDYSRRERPAKKWCMSFEESWKSPCDLNAKAFKITPIQTNKIQYFVDSSQLTKSDTRLQLSVRTRVELSFARLKFDSYSNSGMDFWITRRSQGLEVMSRSPSWIFTNCVIRFTWSFSPLALMAFYTLLQLVRLYARFTT